MPSVGYVSTIGMSGTLRKDQELQKKKTEASGESSVETVETH